MQNTQSALRVKTKENVNKRINSYKIKVGASRQVAIPKKIYEELNLSSGDYLDVEIKNQKLVLTPKVFIEKQLLEGLSDIKNCKVSKPFKDSTSLVKSLRK